jgi:hypothetical protein
MTPQKLDPRVAMQLIALAKKKMRVEREAALAGLRAWFRRELDSLRAEMAEDREELRAARLELERWQRITKDVEDVVRLH